MLNLSFHLDPVFAFYTDGAPSFQDHGLMITDAPFIQGSTNTGSIAYDFIFIRTNAARTQISFYEELVPLVPIANETISTAAVDAFLDAFSTGDVHYMGEQLTSDFQLQVGVHGETEWVKLNKSEYIAELQTGIAQRKAFQRKIRVSSVCDNLVLLQYTWLSTSNVSAVDGAMGRDSLKITLVGNGDYRIQSMYGFRHQNFGWSP